MFVAAALADPVKKESESKVTLDKKLDKRGLLDLGYGYGIHGLDVGYLGGGHGLHHGHGDLHLNSLNLHGHHGGFGDVHGLHGYGHGEHFLGGHVDTVNTVTLVKGVPQPYPVVKHVPVIHEKHVPVHVGVPQPYPGTRFTYYSRKHLMILSFFLCAAPHLRIEYSLTIFIFFRLQLSSTFHTQSM